jgi:hypothetical protein
MKIKNNLLVLPDIKDIVSFKTINSGRSKNDALNKIRENIIKCIPHIDEEYFKDNEYGSDWLNLKNSFENTIKSICPEYKSYKILHKAGRGNNYDYNVIFNDIDNIKIKDIKLEFKYNAENIDEAPQFVSPMKPSQYLSLSFEEYYYNNYLVSLLTDYNLKIPDFETYDKTIHSNKPKCMIEAQTLYYQGCKESSKFNHSELAMNFYNSCNNISRESIKKFIEVSDLNIEKLNKYLIETQDEKIYLLYKNNGFNLQYSDPNDYIIENYEKQPDKFRYLATSKSNKKIKILLRWKNGNGIAFPAFQIS